MSLTSQCDIQKGNSNFLSPRHRDCPIATGPTDVEFRIAGGHGKSLQ